MLRLTADVTTSECSKMFKYCGTRNVPEVIRHEARKTPEVYPLRIVALDVQGPEAYEATRHLTDSTVHRVRSQIHAAASAARRHSCRSGEN